MPIVASLAQPEPPRMTSLPILVVGAGPVGLTLAAALRFQGVDCRIVDKAPAATTTSKALVVWCRSLELLDRLGLATTFVAHGIAGKAGNIHANGSRIARIELASDESPYGFPLLLPQSETEKLLGDHLARQGIAVERSVELVSLEERPDRVVATLRSATGNVERVDASFVVGCDGAHSTVRHLLDLPFGGNAEPNDWLLADIDIAGDLARDEINIFLAEDGVLAIFPTGGARFRVIADLGHATESPRPAPTLEAVAAIVAARGPRGLSVSNPHWLSSFRIHERKVSTYGRGRVYVAGDAAHIHSPAGGQGMNTGMQDAFNLAWKLAAIVHGRGRAEPLLASYTIERSPVAESVLANAGRLTAVATLRHPLAQWLRNHVVPIVASFGFARDRLREEWLETGISYRTSPLSAHGPHVPHGTLAAGDRLPDAPLARPDGETTSLFAILRDPRHALLLVPAADGTGADDLLRVAAEVERRFPGAVTTRLIVARDTPTLAPSVWRDATGRLAAKLGHAGPQIVVVRPDGYLAQRTFGADAAAVIRHLGTYLVAST